MSIEQEMQLVVIREAIDALVAVRDETDYYTESMEAALSVLNRAERELL